MTKLWKKMTSKLTRKNCWWFFKANVLSWIIQGTLTGLLILTGIETMQAMISAKVTSYVVFVGQIVQARRACC